MSLVNALTVSRVPPISNPKCGGEAKRETDVSDTFLDSAWYFFRYLDPAYQKGPFPTGSVGKWLPVDMYIGGAEHSVLHLLYARFITMAFKDIGLISHFEEPFTKFRANGLIISEGAKMSKSKGNVVNPDQYVKEYGADTLRMYLMFIGPFTQGGDFRDAAISGIYRFLQRVWNLQSMSNVKGPHFAEASRGKQMSNVDLRQMHKTIKRVTEDIENLRYNTAIAGLMEWLNYLSKKSQITNNEYQIFLKLLAPFAPHVTEELYQNLESRISNIEQESGTKNLDSNIQNSHSKFQIPNSKFESIHLQSWPKWDEKYLVEESINIPVQVDGRVRATITVSPDNITKEVATAKALESESVKKHIGQKSYKMIYVEGKILNFVTK